MSKMTTDELVAKVESLPALPQAVLKVSQMLENEEIHAEELADIIRLDPDLTSQLLKMVNSAYYGFSRQVGSVKEAVAIVGFKTIKSLVYAIISHRVLSKPVKGYSLEAGALWQNAITGAVYAQYLSERHKYPDPDGAFTAAILRDLGKIVLEEHVGSAYREIEDYARANRVDFNRAELDVLGFSHMEVGKKVAENWNFPVNLQEVIEHHHEPSRLADSSPADTQKLVCIVHLADVLVTMFGVGIGGDGLMYSLDTESLSKAGIEVDANYIQEVMSDLVDMQEVVKSLSDSLTT